MSKLLKKYNIVKRTLDLPKNILAFYIKINDRPYIVMNNILHIDMHDFIYNSCLYFHDNNYNVGKITIFDLENKNFEPCIYARKEMKNSV